ncbi:MAG: hypothetical protein ABIX28_11740 [Vicinamibacterales bacterium]
MSTLSLTFSLVSLALAAVLAVRLARLRRDEQQRSAARITVLSGMAATDFLSESEPLSHTDAFASEPLPASDPEALVPPPAGASPWGPRLAIAGVVVAVLGVAGSIAAFRHSAETPSAHGAAPLELIALDHQQHGSTLSVSGRVRNPGGATPVASPTATVFLFSGDGSFLTSGRARLETPTLTPGSEASFAVAIPVNGTVARYRVSFRDQANQPVAHLDRRTGAPLARRQ